MLTNEFLAFHLIAHMSYHFAAGGCGICPLLDVFLLRRSGGKLRYLFSRVFMPYHAMKQKYPILQAYPILLPFMHVRRWIELFLGGKLKRAVTEVRRSGQIDKKQSQEVQCLLRQLGLE